MSPTEPLESSIHDHGPEDTCERLLDAAEVCFARKGFSAASVREITAAAECNVAAVNYHFRGKESLYEEVFRRRLQALRTLRIQRVQEAMQGADEEASVELLVRTFAAAFLEPLVDHSSGRLAMQLMMQEMLNPHLPEGLLLEEMVIPVRRLLVTALLELAPDLRESDAIACVHSLIGQLLHALHAPRIDPKGPGGDLDAMQRHIVRFTVGGIEAYRRERRKEVRHAE